ncbi:uncharacterized protein B0H18DRAFT_128524 [Fomitopsis serialis]|uniref:uncharacterized protein n=1 Tax=Fomitopsis serialis TaxID=139415 RepID=UPI002008914D|nr:uncharacterized protein B0H18DRAFT_265824 [Neoantrodia serialis]XP_047896047.1 uncharacterized protein B0H18DRAFT_128524 [Neoantrodia serialis]KAH9928204.1 hypothetical protein B0H18DRAFT_265824 [Neoantrodia serialis]KAH9930574.1 hypothetical protein B0H18DRAFT_128524 [Neoantrodia serialis]
MSSQSSLYIALYHIGLGRYHWALIVTPYNTSVNNGPIFQITNQDASQPHSVGEWRTLHKMSTDLLKSSTFVGCVRLPDCNVPAQSIVSWVKEQEPQQGDTPLPAGQVWSCSQWVVRVLQRFMDAGMYRIDLRHFRAKILIYANNLLEMRRRNTNVVHIVSYA